MLSIKYILSRLGIVVGIYVSCLLIFTQPVFQDPVKHAFMRKADSFLSIMLPKAYIALESDQSVDQYNPDIIRILIDDQKLIDAQIAQARATGQKQLVLQLKEFRISFMNFVLIPVFFLIALIAATPVPGKRKSWILIGSLGLLILVIFLKLICYFFYQAKVLDCQVYVLDGWQFEVVSFVFLQLKVGANVIIALMVWLLFAIRFSDLKKISSSMSTLKVLT